MEPYFKLRIPKKYNGIFIKQNSLKQLQIERIDPIIAVKEDKGKSYERRYARH